MDSKRNKGEIYYIIDTKEGISFMTTSESEADRAFLVLISFGYKPTITRR